MLACYTTALAKMPKLAGTVMIQLFIQPSGKPVSVTGSGVDPSVVICIEDVIRKLEFPKPQGGGGAQVLYPFTFRS